MSEATLTNETMPLIFRSPYDNVSGVFAIVNTVAVSRTYFERDQRTGEAIQTVHTTAAGTVVACRHRRKTAETHAAKNNRMAPEGKWIVRRIP